MQAVNIEEKNGLAVNQTTIEKNVSNNICKKQTKISFGTVFGKKFENECFLDEIIPFIKNGDFQEKVLKIRNEKVPEEKAKLKASLPVISSAICKDGIRKNSALIQAGCMIFDLDKFKDASVMQVIKDELAKEAYITFESPSGNGLKSIYMLSDMVRDVETFTRTYKAKGEELKNRFGTACTLDHTHDPVRLCFVSADADIRVNPEAPELKVIAPSLLEEALEEAKVVAVAPCPVQKATTQASLPKAKKVDAHTGNNVSRYADLLSKINPDTDYNTWLDVGISGKNIDEACLAVWDNWSKASPKYKSGECQNKWVSFEQKMSVAEAFNWLEKMTGEKHWWRVFKIETKTSEYDDLYIDEIEKEKFLAEHGIAKTYRDSAESIYIKRDGCIIEEVSRERIADILYDDLKRNPVAYNLAIKKYKEQISGEQTLRSTVSLKEYVMHWDTKDACFLYFADKVLKIEKDKYSTIDYGSWAGDEVIWRDTLLKQKADVIEEKSVFDQFVRNAVGDKNVESIMSCVGYMLHRFKVRSNAKLICFCDGDADVDGGKNKGGRGKGIISNQLLANYRKQKGFDGKKFDPSDNFAWQGLTESHSIIYIEDLRPNFIFEKLFNIITSGLDVNNKNKASFYIIFEKLAKIIIDSNFVVGHDDDSTNRRKIDVPFQKYYSREFTPADEFGHTFFTDWDEQEWAKCNWFVVRCIQLFLEKGLIEADTSSLTKKRIEKEVGPMYDWICANLVFLRNENTLKVIQGKYISDEGLSDKEKIDGKKTAKALRAYAEKHGMTLEVRVVRELASSVKKFRLYYTEAQEKQRDESVEDAMEKYSDELAQLESEYQGEAPF